MDKNKLLSEYKLLPCLARELPPGPWLVLSPHPDDESIGMGGTLAKGAEKGVEILIVEVSSGEMGGDPTVREKETLEALKVLGIPTSNVKFARLPDGKLESEIENIKELIRRIFEELKPLTIYIPSPFEYHPDHRAVCAAAIEWAIESRPEYHHLFAFYEITREAESNFIVCIDEVIDKKIRAIKTYSSQTVDHYIKIALGINQSRCYGITSCNAAEGFFLIPAREHFLLFSRLLSYASIISSEARNIEAMLMERDELIEELKSKLWTANIEFKNEEKRLIQQIHTLNEELKILSSRYSELESNYRELTGALELATKKMIEEKRQKEDLLRELEYLRSLPWFKIAQKYQKIKETLFPLGTRRRRVYDAFRKLIYMIETHGLFGSIDFSIHKISTIIKKAIIHNLKRQFSTELPCSTIRIKPSTDEVSVVSVLYNTQSTEIAELTCSLFQGNIKPKEIIFIDNSEKELSHIIRNLDLSAKVKYIKNCKNLGFGRGVNRGVKEASYKHVLVINPDTKVEPECLEKLLGALKSVEKAALAEARQTPYEHPKFYNPVTLDPVWASGCCFLMDKEAFEEVGGFDENIFLYGEDVDLSWRLKARGYRLVYVPSAKVWHDPNRERGALSRFAPLSNLYLRAKYGASLTNWLGLCLLSGKWPPPKEAVGVLRAGLKEREKVELSAVECAFFERDTFGYEPFRRRGVFTPTLKIEYHPLVSVVIRTHKRGKLLRRALTSVANQSYPEIEVVVVEDKSQEAPAVIEEFPDLRIKYVRVQEGRTRALNAGMKASEGDWILFLDDDDVLFGDAIETLMSHALSEGALFAYGGSLKFETDDKLKGVLKYGYFEEFNRERMMRENFVPMGSFVISRELAERVGSFDESLEYLEDWDFIRRAAKLTDFLFVPKDLLIYCVPRSNEAFWERQAKLDEAYSRVVAKDFYRREP